MRAAYFAFVFLLKTGSTQANAYIGENAHVDLS